MSHKQISKDDVGCISRMLRAGYSFSDIARAIIKHPSAVSRHVHNNGGRENYSPALIKQKKKIMRINAMKSIRILTGSLLRTVKDSLKKRLSPEQISGTLRKKKIYVSKQTIYRYIKERAPHLKIHLRSQKGNYRRKKGTQIRIDQRNLKNKRRIDERPAIIERRGRIGDFEGDTMLGCDKRVRIITYVDRKSRFLIGILLPKTNAELLAKLTIQAFKKIPPKKKRTITYDNGTEFSDYETIEKKTSMKIYFAYPYHSWERGTNENTNGLLREYFPKTFDFNLITEKELRAAVRQLNERPRKILKYKSPRDVFWGLCN